MWIRRSVCYIVVKYTFNSYHIGACWSSSWTTNGLAIHFIVYIRQYLFKWIRTFIAWSSLVVYVSICFHLHFHFIVVCIFDLCRCSFLSVISKLQYFASLITRRCTLPFILYRKFSRNSIYFAYLFNLDSEYKMLFRHSFIRIHGFVYQS